MRIAVVDRLMVGLATMLRMAPLDPPYGLLGLLVAGLQVHVEDADSLPIRLVFFEKPPVLGRVLVAVVVRLAAEDQVQDHVEVQVADRPLDVFRPRARGEEDGAGMAGKELPAGGGSFSLAWGEASSRLK